MLIVLTVGIWLTRECYKIQRRKPTARQTWCIVDTVKKLPASCSGWLQQKEHFFRQICFDEFFALLWASLNVHCNCVVQNTAWSRSAALLDLTMHSPSFLSEGLCYWSTWIYRECGCLGSANCRHLWSANCWWDVWECTVLSVLRAMYIQTNGTARHFKRRDRRGGKYTVPHLLNLVKKVLCKK